MTKPSQDQATAGAATPADSTPAESGIEVRLSRADDRDAVLKFIADMGFNPRDATTWDALHMTAMTAWSGTRLVGAIPMELRPLQLAPGRVVRSLHQTTVAVAEELRGSGIGSRMQRAIAARRPALAPLLTVFREDECSPAYRWYTSNGFRPVMQVTAMMLETPGPSGRLDAGEVCDAARVHADWSATERLWSSTTARRHGGFVCRTVRPVRGWLPVHPYRNRYAFRLATVRGAGGRLDAYAVLGIGRLHSESIRVEILEHAAVDESSLETLIRVISGFANRHGYRPVRWAMAVGDPEMDTARRCGFTPHWRFEMLISPITTEMGELPEPGNRCSLWRYHGLDYA